MDRIGIAVVGYGYWGPNLVRNFRGAEQFEVRYIVEANEEASDQARLRYPEIRSDANLAGALSDSDVQAVAIATPTSSHFELAKAALEAGKHVLVEKPIASSSEEARQLIEIATQNRLTLMVDHTFIYTPAITEIKRRLVSEDLGRLYYYDSTRINLGLFQNDVDVLWDLAVHDLSILLHLVDKRPTHVAAIGVGHVEGHPRNTAFMTLFYPDQFVAHINVNWLSPIKTRRTLIGGERRMIVYDDLEPTEKVKIYDNGIQLSGSKNPNRYKVEYRLGDILVPHIAAREALADMVVHFGESITAGTTPKTDGKMGLAVLKILEAASDSMQCNGHPKEIYKIK